MVLIPRLGEKGSVVSDIKLIGYQGTGGFRDPRYADEPGLIKAGHVGVQCTGDSRIFGFHPTAAAVAAAGSLEALIQQLKRHVPQPGAVFDDTAVFFRAYELAQQGERTTVWQLPIDLPETEAVQIYQALLDAFEMQQPFIYNFPFEDGTFNMDEYNCAVFPHSLGIPLPSFDGRLSVYIPQMIEKGATLWIPSSSPM